MDKNTNTYKERQTVVDKGEDIFERWCKDKGYTCNRFGFDPKEENIDGFYNLNVRVRSLPDFVVNGRDREHPVLVHVKGTHRIKDIDINNYSDLQDFFKEKIFLAFCFDDGVFLKTLDEVKEMCKLVEPGYYPEGKKYYPLNLGR